MRHYETTCVLRPGLGETVFAEVMERTCAIVTDDGGSVIDLDRWGMKQLAYPIKKESQGYYFCLNSAATQSAVQEMERVFRIDDRVLRYLTIKLHDTIDQTGIVEEKERIAAIAAAKAAAAEAEAQENDSAEEKKKSGGSNDADQKQDND
jgi:small subunit ribosomal protein S6